MQIAAMGVEPRLGADDVRVDALDQPPEAARVVHLDEMRRLVRGEVVEHEGRRQYQPPGIRQHAGRRARAPATGLVADRYALEADAERRGGGAAGALEVLLGLALEIVAHAPRDVRRFAGDAEQLR